MGSISPPRPLSVLHESLKLQGFIPFGQTAQTMKPLVQPLLGKCPHGQMQCKCPLGNTRLMRLQVLYASLTIKARRKGMLISNTIPHFIGNAKDLGGIVFSVNSMPSNKAVFSSGLPWRMRGTRVNRFFAESICTSRLPPKEDRNLQALDDLHTAAAGEIINQKLCQRIRKIIPRRPVKSECSTYRTA